MTPMRCVRAPSFTSRMDFLAACCSSEIFLRTSVTNWRGASGLASAGKTSILTAVFLFRGSGVWPSTARCRPRMSARSVPCRMLAKNSAMCAEL